MHEGKGWPPLIHKARFTSKTAKNKNLTNHSLFHAIQKFLFELGEKLTNLTFQLLQVETSNSSAFRPTRIEILILYGKVGDSSGF
jgi:hypothetical protein